mgnify:CR=1 FL=1
MNYPRGFIKVRLNLYANATKIVFNTGSKYTQGRLEQAKIMSANKALLFRILSGV